MAKPGVPSAPLLAARLAATAAALLAGAAWSAEAGDDGGLPALYRQVQQLQDEVRRLQGVVEEQNHRIAQFVREQRERYAEIDRRLLGRGSGSEPFADVPLDAAADARGLQSTPSWVAVDAAGQPLGEQGGERQAYDAAFAAMREGRARPVDERSPLYRIALGMFNELIADYPNGEFTPNAFYWIGEMHMALDDQELARQAFVQVVNLYADHPKAADAMYKLGLTYQRLGDSARAVEYLDRVIRDYPQSAAAEFAEQFKAELP